MNYGKTVLITTACYDKQIANKITQNLLEKRLVSCVQQSKRMSSYWWKDKREQTEEFILTMKTKKLLYKEVEEEIIKTHNYEIPEILIVDIIDGYTKFLDWIDTETLRMDYKCDIIK